MARLKKAHAQEEALGHRSRLQAHIQKTLDSYGPVLEERHAVEEYYPPTHDSDGFPVDERRVVRAGWFKTKAEAEAWMERHEPDRGATLRVKSEYLRERTDKYWVTF